MPPILSAGSRTGPSGYTLIEMLSVIAVSGIMLSVMITAYNSIRQVSVTSQTALNRIRQVGEVEEVFYSLIHQAIGTADAIGEYHNDANQLILEMPPDTDGARRYTVIGCLHPGKIARLDIVDHQGTLSPGYFKTFVLPVRSVEFSEKTEGMIQLNLMVTNAAKAPGKAPIPYSFVAAFRSKNPNKGRSS